MQNELEWLPTNFREYLLDRFATGTFTKREIKNLSELLEGVIFIVETYPTTKRPPNFYKYRYSHPNCEICGRATEVIHHKDQNSGYNKPENYIALCGECHRDKHTRENRKPTLYILNLVGLPEGTLMFETKIIGLIGVNYGQDAT